MLLSDTVKGNHNKDEHNKDNNHKDYERAKTKTSRGLISVGNQLGELLINTEMVFGKGNQMSIEGSPCSVEGTTLSSRQNAT